VTFTASGKSALLQSGEALMIEDKQ